VAIAAFNDGLGCNKKTALLDGSNSSNGPEFEYNWSTVNGNIISGANTLDPTIDAEGVYTLEVLNTINGCTATADVEVLEDSDIIEIVTLEIIHPDCSLLNNGVIEVEEVSGGTEPYMYSIDNGPFSSIKDFGLLAPGQYLITVMDQLGCQSDSLVQINDFPKITLELGVDLDIKLGESVEISAELSIPFEDISLLEWTSNGELPCTDCLSFFVSPLVNTYYQLRVEDSNGCFATDIVEIRVEAEPKIFIPNIFSPNGDGINDVFMFKTEDIVNLVNLFQIYDRWGNVIFQAENFTPGDEFYGWDGKYNSRDLLPGVYTYFIQMTLINDKKFNKKGDITLLR
jgi:gliding motility-associated-like protein